ncbi:MAG TPA: sigma-70 family RNA polymerase sigma factor [Actinocrinis sp.]|nr:sigma-70 family RNA polymerase sigma factor [Actinocrinis sp.]
MGVSRHGGGPPVDLVLAGQAGDPAAVDALLEFSLPLVYNIVGHGLGGHADTDDLVQETMLRVLRGLPQVRDPSAFRSWVAAVAIRQVRWHLADRAQAPRTAALDAAPEPADPQADFVDLCILRLGLTGQRREVAEATRWLDEADRELLGLWWQEAAGTLERSELAAALEVTPQHAAVRVQRMKQQLDGARTVVRALNHTPRCTGLEAQTRAWDHVPGPLWRKRLNRHVRECPQCLACARELVPAEGLLAGVGLVPVVASSTLLFLLHSTSAAPALHGSAAAPGATLTPGSIPGQATQGGHYAGQFGSQSQYSGGGGNYGSQYGGHSASQAPAQTQAQAHAQAGTQSATPQGYSSSPAQTPDTSHLAHPSGPTRAAAKHGGHAMKAAHTFSLGKVVGVACALAVVGTGSVVALNTGNSSPSPAPSASSSPLAASRAPLVLPSATVTTPLPTTVAPTTLPPTTQPAVVVPPKATTSAKKGAATWSFSGSETAFRESGVSWFYTWGADHSGITAPAGVQFVPMIWGAASVTTGNLATAKQDSTSGALLGFNEPDMSSQANMTPQQALALWPQLMSTGLELGSPSVASGAATPGGWLDQFMQGARSKGYRVDFITVHWYGSDFGPAAATSQLEQYLQAIHTRYGLPIWLTEYALIDFSGGTSYPTAQQQAAFVTSSAKMLQGLSWIQRYSWFAFPATTPGQTGLFSPGGAPTPMGSAYIAAGE